MLDSWFAFIGLLAVIAVILQARVSQGLTLPKDNLPLVLQQLHKLSHAGSVGLITNTSVGLITQFCKDKLQRFWHKQHSRVRNVDEILYMWHDVAITKKDLSDIKEDLSSIKQGISDIKKKGCANEHGFRYAWCITSHVLKMQNIAIAT